MLFCILVYDYTLCFIASPCYNVGCYNYNSMRPYYMVIHYISSTNIDLSMKNTFAPKLINLRK